VNTINIMVLRHSAFYSPLLATIGAGFLKEEGLEHTYAIATPDNTVPDGIAQGRVHVAQSAVSTSFAGLERGEHPSLVHFAQINERDGFFIAGRNAEPDFTWDRLVGKDVLVDHFFQPLAMFKYALQRKGVDFNAINVIDAGDVDAIDRAFREGRGDYVHQQGPAPQQMEHEGIAHVVASVGAAVGPVAFSSLCASREWLETDMALAFMRAYRKGRQFVIDSPARDVAQVVAEFFPSIDRDVLIKTIETYQGLGCWVPDPAISREAYEAVLDVFLYSGLITKRHSYDAVITLPPDQR
jgi:NitT/TauT family transport system substrate-binding protein